LYPVKWQYFCNVLVRYWGPSRRNLSPLLFSLYLNDLLANLISKGNSGITLDYASDDNIESLTILALLFADDTIILVRNPQDFQKCLILTHTAKYIFCCSKHINQNYCQDFKKKQQRSYFNNRPWTP
jgi:hypothetical protein